MVHECCANPYGIKIMSLWYCRLSAYVKRKPVFIWTSAGSLSWEQGSTCCCCRSPRSWEGRRSRVRLLCRAPLQSSYPWKTETYRVLIESVFGSVYPSKHWKLQLTTWFPFSSCSEELVISHVVPYHVIYISPSRFEMFEKACFWKMVAMFLINKLK